VEIVTLSLSKGLSKNRIANARPRQFGRSLDSARDNKNDSHVKRIRAD
jgi:hypothetical protein